MTRDASVGEGSFRDADEVRRGDDGDAIPMIDTLRAGLHRACAQRAGRAATA